MIAAISAVLLRHRRPTALWSSSRTTRLARNHSGMLKAGRPKAVLISPAI
jgi:hypothetical protein